MLRPILRPTKPRGCCEGVAPITYTPMYLGWVAPVTYTQMYASDHIYPTCHSPFSLHRCLCMTSVQVIYAGFLSPWMKSSELFIVRSSEDDRDVSLKI